MAEEVNWGSSRRGRVPTGATQHITVSVGPSLQAANAAGEVRASQARPSTAPFAMSSPDRRRSPSPSPLARPAEAPPHVPQRPSSPSPQKLREIVRPQSAPGLRSVGPKATLGEPNVFMQHGRLSLYDAVEGGTAHEYLGALHASWAWCLHARAHAKCVTCAMPCLAGVHITCSSDKQTCAGV